MAIACQDGSQPTSIYRCALTGTTPAATWNCALLDSGQAAAAATAKMHAHPAARTNANGGSPKGLLDLERGIWILVGWLKIGAKCFFGVRKSRLLTSSQPSFTGHCKNTDNPNAPDVDIATTFVAMTTAPSYMPRVRDYRLSRGTFFQVFGFCFARLRLFYGLFLRVRCVKG